jgi:putative PEP-CTERM system TPR-repeat lipoprotein
LPRPQRSIPKNAGKRTSLAMVNLAKGDSDVAFRDLEQVAAADPGNPGRSGADRGAPATPRVRSGAEGDRRLEKKQPDNPLTCTTCAARHCSASAMSAGARKSFEQALALNAAYFPAAANLANLDLAEKKPEDARKRFEAVLAKDPKNARRRFLALAECVPKRRHDREVATLINKAVTANPTESAPRLALIGLYLGKNEVKSALAAAQDAVAALPERPEILDAAGRAQQAAQDYNQALATYGKLAATETRFCRCPICAWPRSRWRPRTSRLRWRICRRRSRCKPDSLEAQRGIMMLELDAGRQGSAGDGREVQKQRPKEAVGYLFEGDAQASLKNWAEAIAAYRDRSQGSWRARSGGQAAYSPCWPAATPPRPTSFAETWLKEHAKDTASASIWQSRDGAQGLCRRCPAVPHSARGAAGQPDRAQQHGLGCGQIKDPKAIEYAEKANKLAPNQPALMDTLAVLLMDKGDHAAGAGAVPKALELAPQASQIRVNYAQALIKAGKKSEARSNSMKLAKLGDKFPAQAEVAQLQGAVGARRD